MEFEKRKAFALEEMASSAADKSPKGTIDAPIIPLLNILNQHPSYFTTSSCSGRISILSQPRDPQQKAKKKKKAAGGSWLFMTHDPADPESVVHILFRSNAPSSIHESLVFRFEPFILAVECNDVSSAQILVSSAVSCGFRESGEATFPLPFSSSFLCFSGSYTMDSNVNLVWQCVYVCLFIFSRTRLEYYP